MKPPIHQCHYEGCNEIFDHTQKRARHEVLHKKKGHQLKKKPHICKCCHPPRLFKSAADKAAHKRYQTHKNEFECPKCRVHLSTDQKLKEHDTICTQVRRNLKALQKLADRERKQRTTGGKSDEEEKHSNLDPHEESTAPGKATYDKDDMCQECGEPIWGERSDEWWCDDCGYGLCADCRPDSALNHVYGCPNARKSVLSKRTKNTK